MHTRKHTHTHTHTEKKEGEREKYAQRHTQTQTDRQRHRHLPVVDEQVLVGQGLCEVKSIWLFHWLSLSLLEKGKGLKGQRSSEALLQVQALPAEANII